MTEIIIHFQPENFRQKLIRWFHTHCRDLPWRGANHWYPVFLSEMLLQQTQVEQALPYYQKFISRYPSVYDLAQADEQEVLTLWAGLGYYARARNMLKAARQIVSSFHGLFPENYKDALSLPGIGPYTAAAVLSIAYRKPLPVVDGNVLRVITRIFAVDSDIRQARTQNRIRELLQKLIDRNDPGNFNEGLMELGALVCTPQNPRCTFCPVEEFCQAKNQGLTAALPFKSKPPAKKRRYHYVLVIKNRDRYLLTRRGDAGLLAAMWEFPILEVQHLNHSEKEIIARAEKMLGTGLQLVMRQKKFKHIYSHIRLEYVPVLLALTDPAAETSLNAPFVWSKTSEFKRYALHRAHQKLFSHPDTKDWFNN